MAEFIVHSIPGSPFGRAVLATLEQKGGSYRLNPVGPGTFRSEPHISRHPFGKVPVLQHGDFMLYETQAIQRYLDRILPGPSLTPADPRRAARMDQVMNISDWYLFQGFSAVVGFQRVVGPKLLGLTPDEALIEATMPKGHEVFAELSRLLGSAPFFCGDTLSLADILVAAQMDMLAEIPEWPALTEGRTNLAAWMDRMNGLASLQATTWPKVAEVAARSETAPM